MPDGSRRAGFGGVATCGSVWCCPQDAAVIATRRGEELAQAMRAVDAQGGSAFMATLTVRHKRHQRLGWSRAQRRENTGLLERARDRARALEAGDEIDQAAADADAAAREVLDAARGTWDAVADGWQAVISGSTWTKDQQRCGGLLGWVRVVETTLGRSGWHTHVHCLLAFADQVTEQDVRPIVGRMFGRWNRALHRAGYDASGDMAQDGKVPGWDVRRAQLDDNAIANYFTKLAHEVTGAHRKEGHRPGGRTPMQLLVDATDTYTEADLAKWWEWEQASEGRRQLTWSGGRRSLRELAQLGDELTDQELAEQELPADSRLGLPGETWGWVRAGQHETTVIDVTEDHGLDGLIRWLDEHDQTYVTGAGAGWAHRPDTPDHVPVPRDEGIGYGWTLATPAVLRGRDPDGRPQRRPSDRPPRWTDDARAVLPHPPAATS